MLFGLDLLSRVNPFKTVTVDDWFDQLNRSFMFSLIIILGTTITIRDYSGRQIACHGFQNFERSFHEDYCWTQGLYTIAEAYHWDTAHVPYPGIIPDDIPYKCDSSLAQCPERRTTKVFHLWYQWVTPYFWVVAISFYFPYLIYKRYGFEIKPLLVLLHSGADLRDKDAFTEEQVERAAVWLYHRLAVCMKSGILRRHGVGILFVVIKITYLAVSVLVMQLTSVMFQLADFKKFGYIWAVEEWPTARGPVHTLPGNKTAIKDLLFPKMVACEIKRWGTTGLEEENGMCILTRNVMNQYMFLILWWALAFIIVINIFNVFAGFCTVLFVGRSYRWMLGVQFLHDKKEYRDVYSRIGSSGRMIIMMLMKNCEPEKFRKIMDKISKELVENNLHR